MKVIFNKKCLGSSLLICGTSVGAGMLALPSITGILGFIPATLVMILSWIFMTITGCLLADICIWMKKPSTHLPSIAKYFLGQKGELIICLLFLFLYECLLISYLSGASPFIANFLKYIFSSPISETFSIIALTILIVLISSRDIQKVDFINKFFTIGLIISFIGLIVLGVSAAETEKLSYHDWSKFLLPLPILMGAFGYHNVIPSIVDYLEKDEKKIKTSIIFGTFLSLLIYIIWNALILGSINPNLFSEASSKQTTIPIINILMQLSGNQNIGFFVYYFTFFAIITSLIGVSFSMVDFLDNLFSSISFMTEYMDRTKLAVLSLTIPAIVAIVYPNLFVKAFSVAAGYGEVALNGLFPIFLIFLIAPKLSPSFTRSKLLLILLSIFAVLVIIIESLNLFAH